MASLFVRFLTKNIHFFIADCETVIHLRVNEASKIVSASFVNCTIGKYEGAEQLIKDPAGDQLDFVSQYLPTTRLEARKEAGGYVIK